MSASSDKRPSLAVLGRILLGKRCDIIVCVIMTSHDITVSKGMMSHDKIPFLKKYLLRQNFDREYILAEGILSEKVFRRRRYFVLEGIMSGYRPKHSGDFRFIGPEYP